MEIESRKNYNIIRRMGFVYCLLQYCLLSYSYSLVSPFVTEHELDNHTVFSVYCSKSGFVWLATDAGISKYDGFRFRDFPLNSVSDSDSYPTDCSVYSISENGNHLLYLKMLQGGIACFDERKEAYIPLKLDAPFAMSDIEVVCPGIKDEIYIGTKKGLYAGTARRNMAGEKETLLISIGANPLISGSVSLIRADKQELVVCVDKTAIWTCQPMTHKVEILQSREENDREITAFRLQDGYLWACSSQGLMRCYDRERRTLIRTIDSEVNHQKLALANTRIKAMMAIDNNTYYIATWNGLFRLLFKGDDLATADYTLERVQQSGLYPSSSVKLSGICWNRSHNILWLAAYGCGIMKFDFTRQTYKRIPQRFDADVMGMEQDMRGYVWLTVKQKGLWRSSTNTLTENTVFEPWTKGVNPNGSYCLYKDRNGFLWTGDKTSRVICINPVGEAVTEFCLKPDGMGDFSANIRQFCWDARNRLWIVTTEGLLLYDTKNDVCKLIELVDENGQVKDLFSIAEDKNGSLWLATDCGVKQMKYLDGKASLGSGYEEESGLKKRHAFSLYVNNNNQVLASYIDKMLSIERNINDGTEDFSSKIIDGLRHVFCMVDDLNGNTWLSDASGIVTLRNDRELFYRYPLKETFTKVCRLEDGNLLWANADGLLFFDPLATKSNAYKGAPVLSSLEVKGQPVAVGQSVNGRVILQENMGWQQKLVFYANDEDISFYFSDLQFSGKLRKLAYRLLPNEKWNMSMLEEGVTYRNLSAGEYVLQAKLVYPDATESLVLEIPVLVKNNWWKTYWAYGLYILVGLAFLAGVYLLLSYRAKIREANRIRELSLREMLDVEKMQREHDMEIENMRDRLLALFVQNIRTPLALVIASLKELSGEQLVVDDSSKMGIAYRSSVNMLDACNQLLAIYTEKLLKEELKVSLYPVDKLVNDTVFAVKELISINQIEFNYVEKTAKRPEAYMDHRRMSFIIHNLLSNAFHHIQYSGTVSLCVSESVVEGVRYCTISVHDSGKQKVHEAGQCLPGDEEYYFKNVSTVELGYDIMERIIESHHGFMCMNSEDGEGTEVVLNIPIDKEVLENDPDIVFMESELGDEPAEKPAEKVEAFCKEEKVVQEKDEQQLPEEVILQKFTHSMAASSSTSKKKTLLLVEDHKDTLLYLTFLFRNEYNILVAVNGQEGAELAHKELPDLVLCDVMMPVKDGFQCCKEIKESLDTCHIPVIFLTAKVEDVDVIHGLDMGADDYILKPFASNVLKAKVRNLINGRVMLKQMYTKLLVLPNAENGQKEKEEEKLEDPFVSQVVKIVEDNIREADFSVKKLAAEMNMSQPTLYRKIKQITDFTVIELIRGVRMRTAANLLKEKGCGVQEAAEMVGYNDVPTFRKHFVDTYGATPSAYASSVDAKECSLF